MADAYDIADSDASEHSCDLDLVYDAKDPYRAVPTQAPTRVPGRAHRGRSVPTGLGRIVTRFDPHDLYCDSPFGEVASSSMDRDPPIR
eukprot:16316589-Heterocapsa_arctica.AAC.1